MDKKYYELKKRVSYPFLADPSIIGKNVNEKNETVKITEKENLYTDLIREYITGSHIDENVLLQLFQKAAIESGEEIVDLDKIETIIADAEPIEEGLFDETATEEKNTRVEMGFRSAGSMKKAPENNTSKLENTSQTNRVANKENNKENDQDAHLKARIESTIVNISEVNWADISGLERTKSLIQEIVIWPMLRPDLFTGLRSPPKGILLFGPPGTGKTMLGKCIASQIDSTFFSISASSLTSKWMGESEKTVKFLFQIAREKAPSVIFIDEIDSLLSKRAEGESEGGRKIKTEFLVQFDGILSDQPVESKDVPETELDDKEHIIKYQNKSVLVIGATNRPQEIDEAVRRRFVKRVYVPLPDQNGIKDLLKTLLSKYECTIQDSEYDMLSEKLIGYSGSDVYNLCREAVMEPLREIDISKGICELRPIKSSDIIKAMNQIRKSVSQEDLKDYEKWNNEYGSK
ncbi:AAA+-type ATPase [Pseudoloma neurophilia]|uniref:AAA+-type ATPase n=1 Tax=Pseudoloma neurophilia TaxID=146866 RepID=A0A0R0M7U4_9MICR|nr:AAA+-type ATPase [Pseudoloma neurophilia]